MNFDLHNLMFTAAYLALIYLIGYTTICTVSRAGVRHWAELLGLCFAAGAGVLSVLLFVVSIAGVKPSRTTLVAIAVIALLGLLNLWKQKQLLSATVPSPRGKADVFTPLGLLSLVLLIAAAGNVWARARWTGLDDIDVFAIWLFKAKWVSMSTLRPVPAVFFDPTLSYSHQDYPLSLPFLVAGLYAVTASVDDATAKLLCLPIYLSLVAIIYAAVRRLHRRSIAVCITAIFAASPTLCQNGGILVAETSLLLALTAASTLLLRWIELQEPGDLILAGLFAAIAAFTKNEGLAILPVFGLTSLLLAIKRKQLKEWLMAAAACAVAIGPWLIFRIHLPKTHEDYGSKLTSVSSMTQNLSRIGYVLPRYFGRMFDAPRVGLVWYVLFIVALLGIRAFARTGVRVLYCILVAQLLLYLGTFVVTPWDVALLLSMIAPKLLTQASPLAMLLISLHLREVRPTGSDKLRAA